MEMMIRTTQMPIVELPQIKLPSINVKARFRKVNEKVLNCIITSVDTSTVNISLNEDTSIMREVKICLYALIFLTIFIFAYCRDFAMLLLEMIISTF